MCRLASRNATRGGAGVARVACGHAALVRGRRDVELVRDPGGRAAPLTESR